MNDVIRNNHILKDTADYSFGSFCITSFSDPTNPQIKNLSSLYVSGKLPTYPSLKPTFCPKREVSVNVGLGEG